MGNRYYKLEGKKAVPCDNLIEWAKWFETADRHLAAEDIGDSRISTVFLGIDHGFGAEVRLFETMVFGGELDGEQTRCATWAEAAHMHVEMLAKVKASVKE